MGITLDTLTVGLDALGKHLARAGCHQGLQHQVVPGQGLLLYIHCQPTSTLLQTFLPSSPLPSDTPPRFLVLLLTAIGMCGIPAMHSRHTVEANARWYRCLGFFCTALYNKQHLHCVICLISRVGVQVRTLLHNAGSSVSSGGCY